MSRAALERKLPAGQRLLLDTSALIAHLDGGEEVSPVATHIVDGPVREGRNPALVSMVSVMEILVRPLRDARPEYLHALDFLVRHPNLQLQPVDLPVAEEAARMRAMFGLAAPDALIVATGIANEATQLVTNDRRWTSRLQRVKSTMSVIHLADYIPL